ncbi:MAG TPA: class I SAM-dependent methyltransferase [Thermoanaerobaculia bacterium]|nr:class I SAM-dependent methyltransferase [Thermoanaerobaculia bacterium]
MRNPWDDPETVARFAAREPDRRLADLLDAMLPGEAPRVLDLGCAGGRNTVLLAQRGCDVHALDASAAMVAETRRRLAQIAGAAEAEQRVLQGKMDDLSRFGDGELDLVIALGVFQEAGSLEEWHRAVDESARVLRPDGRLLVAHFAPGTDLTGHHGAPIEGRQDLYEPSPGSRNVLLGQTRLDAAMREHGLMPVVPSETVNVGTGEGGRRVTVNALYRRG